MYRLACQLVVLLTLSTAAAPFVGCGTTRSSDTSRTATEQLLISDAIDRAVQQVNVGSLGGQTVFFDDSRLGDVVDRNYLISTLRQHLLANGCQLREKREDAEFIVEARAGAVGTDRNDLLFGVPSMNVPQIMPLQPVPAAIPEIPIAKRKDQRGIAKLAVFAYHRETGTPVWQSGLVHQESSSNDVWILGAGPFQRGTIHAGTEFAGKALRHDAEDETMPKRLPPVDIAHESTFASPQRLAHQQSSPAAPPAEVQTSHQEPAVPDVATPADPIAAVDPTSGQPDATPIPLPTQPPAAASIYTPADTQKLPQPRFDPRE
jgi:hypothetical protein